MIKRTKNQTAQPNKQLDQKLPFIEHVYELRKRLFYVAVFVIAFTLAGYFIQQRLVHFLLAPAHGQQFIYTTPTGGLNFLFQVCIYFGITLSIPVFIYQILRYIQPLIKSHTKTMMARYSFTSWVLALGGSAFGYYVGLPVALSFLGHQFTTTQIKPLLTIQEYMSFVMIYLMGSALLFQVPLILLFINRIKPMSPKKLLSFERYFVALAFIAAAIMTPTPDVFNQALFAIPIIAVYQVGIILIYFQNRRSGKYKTSPDAQTSPRADLSNLPPNPFLGNDSPQPASRPTARSPRPIAPVIPRPAARPMARVWDIG